MSKKYIRNKLTTPTVSNLGNSEFDKLKRELTLLRKIEKTDQNKSFRVNRKQEFSKKNLKRKERKALLDSRSVSLATDLPKSEAWFYRKYFKEHILRQFTSKRFQDQFNKPTCNWYIPDVSNKGYRYIIEIDGSFHDRADQKLKDAKKDYNFKKRGYKVIRIKAFDEASYQKGMAELRDWINEYTVQSVAARGDCSLLTKKRWVQE